MAVFLFLFIFLGGVRAYYLDAFNREVSNKIDMLKEEARPAILQFVGIVDSSCTNCFDINRTSNIIRNLNVNITSSETLEYPSTKAKQLIDRFGIKTVPALIISGEIDKPNVADIWYQLNGEIVGEAVHAKALPPYRNLTSGKIEGLVSLVMLTDDSCNNCYNVSAHKRILPSYGVVVISESTYDINSTKGKELLALYNITKVPTILLSPDAKVYSGLLQVWRGVGSFEPDGWLVFRSTEQMGNYTDLTTGQVVAPE